MQVIMNLYFRDVVFKLCFMETVFQWLCGYSELLPGLEIEVGETQEGRVGAWRSIPPLPINP